MRSCTFIGHKNCENEIKQQLFLTIEKLIIDKNVTVFYVGTQGNFDRLVYASLCELEETYSIKIFVVLAYLKDQPFAYYDKNKTIFPDELTKVPLRLAIRRRNSFMIDNSDFVVCYLNNSFSNTFPNVIEALKKKKQVINLGKVNLKNIAI